MKVWSFVSQKGGVGKSTLATQLGVLAQQKGQHVALVDVDAQASAFKWYERRRRSTDKRITRGGPYVMRALPSDLGKIIAAAPTMGATLLIIDTARATDDGALAAVRAANLIVVPTKPLPFELDALGDTAKLLALAQRKHLTLVVVNGITSGKKIEAKEYDRVVEEVRPSELRVCTNYICNRKQISDAIGEGMGITEQAAPEVAELPKGPKGDAAREIIALWDELHLFVPTASNVVKLGAAR
jgi:chromosome partitioning protein